MSTLAELARTNTALRGDALAHVQRLIASWAPLADLCFSDLLFLAPIEGERGARGKPGPLRHRVSWASAVGHACAPHPLGTVASLPLFLEERGKLSHVFSQ